MNAQSNMETQAARVTKVTKNRIRVDYEGKMTFWQRLKIKITSSYFLTQVLWYFFRFVLMIGISYVILFPFFSKIAGSFMGYQDFVDVTVRVIPKHFTFETYRAIFVENNYLAAFTNTALLSVSSALLQTFVCTLIGYGLAKFKFKGNSLVMLLVVLTMIVPHETLRLSLTMHFRYFDFGGLQGILREDGVRVIPGIFQILGIGTQSLLNTFWPLLIISATGLAFKNGLYIFMMRQFFRGVPDELEESAYVDGATTMRTFFNIILPLSVPMMITVFLFAFSWQWTDEFYTKLFFPTANKVTLMPDIVAIPPSLEINYAGQSLFYTAIKNTAGIMIIMPLVIVYLFCQKYLVQGIERSGIVG